MPFHARLAAVSLALLACLAVARAEEPMNGTFIAGRSCDALVSIRKETNPDHAITGPGIRYKLLAANQKKATSYRIEIPTANPPERWVRAECGSIVPAEAAAATPAPAKPAAAEQSYVLALSWQPAFCEDNQKKPECRWQTGQRYDANYLSLHGLWPQPRGLEYCNMPDKVRAAGEGGRWKDLPELDLRFSTKADLEQLMPGYQSLLERHEWAKHGSCYPGDADAYFRDSFRLLKEVNGSPVADVFLQNIGRQVSTANIRAAFDQGFGQGAGNRVRVTCRDSGGRRLITEITLGLKGDIRGGSSLSDLILAAPPSDPGCPAGIVDPVGPQ